MARQSPMRHLHEQAQASTLVYGPAEDPAKAVDVVETFGELEIEYAFIRKHAVLIDQPHRAVIELTGPDRLDFLNRMITQELKGLAPSSVRRAFWLNTKGRIEADVRVVELGDRTLLELDVLAAERTAASLARYIITEDVTLTDLTERTHRLALHGPEAIQLLASCSTHERGPSLAELKPDAACVVKMLDASVVVFRDDACGEIGLELIVPVEAALAIDQHLLASAGEKRIRAAGCHAFNIARIEAGRPLYNLDFGSTSLPAETGVLLDRVSFTKGCYLGQEIVARMHARGNPKQCLVPIKFESQIEQESGMPRQPVTGSPLSLAGGADVIGQVTSSTLAPMVGSSPVALAQVRFAHIAPGTVLTTMVEGVTLKGVIQPQLAFLQPR